MGAADFAIGQVAHFVVAAGQHRAAVVTKLWGHRSLQGSPANLTVFLDDEKDERYFKQRQEGFTGSGPLLEVRELAPLIWRVTGVPEDQEGHQVGTWHWPEQP